MQLSKKLKMRRQIKKECDVDITSLLDILVILLVFLLKSYSASDLRVDLVENLSLPSSMTEELGEMAVIVQINRAQNIWVNDVPIGKLARNGEIITNLNEKLAEIKQSAQQEFEAKKRSPTSTEPETLQKAEDKLKRINLIIDEELPYSVMRQVMHTSALAGFPEFKFIVRGLGE